MAAVKRTALRPPRRIWYLETKYGPWEFVPRYHWRRLFGYDIRRPLHDRSVQNIGWCWRYGRSRLVAHDMLHSVYGEKGESVVP